VGVVEEWPAQDLKHMTRWQNGTNLEFLDEGNDWGAPLITEDSHVRWFRMWKNGETIGPAKLYLLTEVNRSLLKLTSAMVLLNGDGSINLYGGPDTLLAAMWLQVAELITGKKIEKRCRICKDILDVTNSRRHKQVHEVCSLRERMRRYRKGKSDGKKARSK
jgi:hypothetical protein